MSSASASSIATEARLELRPLGESGIDVSAIALGTMMFGSWGNPDAEECRTMVEVAIDRGVTFFDSADIYDQGNAERILGRALGHRRADVVVATKFGLPMGTDPADQGSSPRWIRKAVDASLARLGSEWIDLYQVHVPDRSVPIADTLGALGDLVNAGKIRAYGTSNFPADELVDGQWVARTAGLAPPVSEQPPYSLLVRGAETDDFPACLHHRIGAVVYSPLNGGWLTGKYRAGSPPGGSRAATFPDHIDVGGPFHAEKVQIVEQLRAIASDVGCSLAGLAIAFAREHPAVSSVIIGPKTPEQLDALLASVELRLDTATLDAIDAVVAPGRDVNPADGGRVRPEHAPAARRRPR